MALLCPTTEAQFLELSGVTYVKCAKYGERFMAIIREYVAKHGRPALPPPVLAVPFASPPGLDQGTSRFFTQVTPQPPPPSRQVTTGTSTNLTGPLDAFKFEDSSEK
jgi:hypothetical protein